MNKYLIILVVVIILILKFSGNNLVSANNNSETSLSTSPTLIVNNEDDDNYIESNVSGTPIESSSTDNLQLDESEFVVTPSETNIQEVLSTPINIETIANTPSEIAGTPTITSAEDDNNIDISDVFPDFELDVFNSQDTPVYGKKLLKRYNPCESTTLESNAYNPQYDLIKELEEYDKDDFVIKPNIDSFADALEHVRYEKSNDDLDNFCAIQNVRDNGDEFVGKTIGEVFDSLTKGTPNQSILRHDDEYMFNNVVPEPVYGSYSEGHLFL